MVGKWTFNFKCVNEIPSIFVMNVDGIFFAQNQKQDGEYYI